MMSPEMSPAIDPEMDISFNNCRQVSGALKPGALSTGEVVRKTGGQKASRHGDSMVVYSR